MTGRPARTVQTSKEARRQYNKHGPQVPLRQQRQLERAHQLDQRAAKARALEERKRFAKQKREERERKDRDARRQLGVGLATQLVGYSHTQKRLKSGMEAFLGVQKKHQRQNEREQANLRDKLDAIAAAVEKEPWDADSQDQVLMDELSSQVCEEDTLFDDDLDDDTLLEAHNVFMLHVSEDTLPSRPEPAPVRHPVKPSSDQQAHVPHKRHEFSRLHGPINKRIEEKLEQLPGPLLELLSTDTSANVHIWDPPPSLLHKLNPLGLPPHRLRIKVGCAVSLLRDLDTSSQLSRSNHLKITRVEKERLDCLVLDGPLVGMKTLLMRVPFFANYRNNENTPFRRTQYPIRVSPDFVPPEIPRFHDGPALLPPTLECSTKPRSNVKNESMSISENVGFKIPSVPKSKSSEPPPLSTPRVPNGPPLLDAWDDFLASGTQIARELSLDKAVGPKKTLAHHDSTLKLVTQDSEFAMEDLDELTLFQVDESQPPSMKPSPGVLLRGNPSVESPKALEFKHMTSYGGRRPKTPVARPHVVKQPFRKSEALGNCTYPLLRSSSTDLRVSKSSEKRPYSTKRLGTLSEFGLCTQDVISIFEDEELCSPTMVV